MNEAPDAIHTGKDLRAALIRYNLSGARFAELVGVDRATVSRWIRGVHPMPKLVRTFFQERTTIDGKINKRR